MRCLLGLQQAPYILCPSPQTTRGHACSRHDQGDQNNQVKILSSVEFMGLASGRGAGATQLGGPLVQQHPHESSGPLQTSDDLGHHSLLNWVVSAWNSQQDKIMCGPSFYTIIPDASLYRSTLSYPSCPVRSVQIHLMLYIGGASLTTVLL